MTTINPLTSVAVALKQASLIPDVLPESFIPSSLLIVSWQGDKEALLGNELQKADVAEEPTFKIVPMNIPLDSTSSSDVEPTYTVAFFDPDAPSRADPKYKSFRHWVITGLKAPTTSAIVDAGGQMALSSKPATTPYRPPAPGPGTGFHRYVFLLFQEPTGGIEVPQGEPEYGSALEERRSWDAHKFAEKYGLTLLAANFFICKVEEA